MKKVDVLLTSACSQVLLKSDVGAEILSTLFFSRDVGTQPARLFSR